MAPGRMQWPGDDSRVLVVGGTGSGKSWAALHQLSQRSIDTLPWIVMDFKGHGLLREIPVTDVIDLDDAIPENPGLYYLAAPFHSRNDYPTSDFFKRALARGNVGLFVDEGQGPGQWNSGFAACCYAGREAGVPMIICTQRPQGLPQHARSQAGYVQLFQVDSENDRKEMQDTIDRSLFDTDALLNLPRYHSVWIDKAERRSFTRRPCPEKDEIIETIFRRMAPPPGDEQPAPVIAEIAQKRHRIKI